MQIAPPAVNHRSVAASKIVCVLYSNVHNDFVSYQTLRKERICIVGVYSCSGVQFTLTW